MQSLCVRCLVMMNTLVNVPCPGYDFYMCDRFATRKAILFYLGLRILSN